MNDDQIVMWLFAWGALGLPGVFYGLAKGMIFEGFMVGFAVGPFSLPLLRSMHRAKIGGAQSQDSRTQHAQDGSRAQPGQSADDDRQRQDADARQRAQERIREEQARRVAEAEQKRRVEEEEAKRREEEQQRSASPRDEKYYGRVLSLKGAITRDEVKRRYRELVAQYHPDKVNHLGPKLRTVAEQEMKEINAAYDFFRRTYGI